ncbi:MAG TPA: CcdB family protein, partial [Rhodoferax sp.]|nr:CcdB family protein [Rhodoferax sp.]
MARFDVYANPDASERALIPFLLDVQNDYIQGLQTRVVVPLWDGDALLPRAADLNPEFEVAGRRVAMDTPALGAIPVALLRQTVGNLVSQQIAIQN